jgi:hypothetical protein
LKTIILWDIYLDSSGAHCSALAKHFGTSYGRAILIPPKATLNIAVMMLI